MTRASSLRSSFAVAAAVLVSSSCDARPKSAGAALATAGGRTEATSLPPLERQYIVGIDISGSRTPTQLREARRLLDGVINQLSNGDKLVLVETYQGGTDEARQWKDDIPPRRSSDERSFRDSVAVSKSQRAARRVAHMFFDTTRAKQIKSTDLLGTLTRAADYAKASAGRQTIVLLLSDMIQYTPEVRMDRLRSIPSPNWITERRQEGRLPNLQGVCVFAVGTDVTSARGVAIRNFWARYFTATGASFDPATNYRNMISDPSEIRC